MCEIRRVKSNTLFPLIAELLEEDRKVVITVTGSSMYPFLRENIDRVELTNSSFENIKKGDIVMAVMENGRYVLHRVISKNKDCFYIIGDAQCRMEGPLYSEQLVAEVTSIWRGTKRILCTNLWWRFMSFIWMLLLPYRGNIFRFYRFLRGFI